VALHTIVADFNALIMQRLVAERASGRKSRLNRYIANAAQKKVLQEAEDPGRKVATSASRISVLGLLAVVFIGKDGQIEIHIGLVNALRVLFRGRNKARSVSHIDLDSEEVVSCEACVRQWYVRQGTSNKYTFPLDEVHDSLQMDYFVRSVTGDMLAVATDEVDESTAGDGSGCIYELRPEVQRILDDFQKTRVVVGRQKLVSVQGARAHRAVEDRKAKARRQKQSGEEYLGAEARAKANLPGKRKSRRSTGRRTRSRGDGGV
jgi:hypothetical protein